MLDVADCTIIKFNMERNGCVPMFKSEAKTLSHVKKNWGKIFKKLGIEDYLDASCFDGLESSVFVMTTDEQHAELVKLATKFTPIFRLSEWQAARAKKMAERYYAYERFEFEKAKETYFRLRPKYEPDAS